eukprot:gene37767-50983_t
MVVAKISVIIALIFIFFKTDLLADNDRKVLEKTGKERSTSDRGRFRKNNETRSTATVLVTGINGMIGSHVAKELVRQRKFRVIGLVRPRSNLDSLTSILTRIELVIGDITDPFRMIDVINSTRPKYLYHFAAQ